MVSFLSKNIVDNNKIQALLSSDEVTHIEVTGDGYHVNVLIVSDEFLDKPKVARQRYVYQKLNPYIASGELHAVTINALTTKEWGENHG